MVNVNRGWDEISHEEYYHNLHFKQGTKIKHNKLCELMTLFLLDNMSDRQKYDIIRELIHDKFQLMSPKDLINTVLENNCGEYLEQAELSPADFIE